MNVQPLVSVVIIFRDAERFLDEAISSVYAQTCSDWELLLVDDGSIDGSAAHAAAWAARDPGRVRCLAHPGGVNRGMSASRNLGIRRANGEYLAFLDADDVWLPDKLTHQVAALKAWPDAAMVYGPTEWWYSWTHEVDDSARDFVHPLGVPTDTPLQPPTLLAHMLRREGASPCICSVLVRRDVVRRVGAFEEAFTGLYEDQVFMAKLCLDFEVVATSRCLYRYRQHADSACSVAERAGAARSARIRFLTWLEGYLTKRRVDDPRLWHIVRHELRRSRYPLLARNIDRAGNAVKRGMRLADHGLMKARALPVVRQFRCLQLRRMRPLANGRQRGTPVVRAYWSRYLRAHAADLHGHALEIGTTATLRQHGGSAFTQIDALDLVAHSPEVSAVADLSRADHLPSNTYDCFLNQFTMHLIYDVEAALYHSVRILKPGGVLLVNFPCVDYYFPSGLDMSTGGTLFVFWWFTQIQVENLLRRVGLCSGDFELTVFGNLFARIAYQLNLPAEELTRQELEYVDPGHPLLICARVVKPLDWQPPRPEYRDACLPDVEPARWNPETGHYG